jgi:hypothetical protein
VAVTLMEEGDMFWVSNADCLLCRQTLYNSAITGDLCVYLLDISKDEKCGK